MINGLNESKQASRIEAKIHEVLKCVQQMRISLISSMAASAVAPIEKISELPVATPSALDHLESGLNTPTHRKKIVSVNDDTIERSNRNDSHNTDSHIVCFFCCFFLFTNVFAHQTKNKHTFLVAVFEWNFFLNRKCE